MIRKVLIFLVSLAVAALGAEIGAVPEHPMFAVKRRGPKIVGGEEAKRNSMPHQAALFCDNYFCGGSLITSRTVVTAAHCLDGIRRVTILLGGYDLGNQGSGEVVMVASGKVIHPQWNSATLSNDIGLVMLPQSAPLSHQINTVALDYGKINYEGKPALISGWGRDNDNATSISRVLRFVHARIITQDECGDAFGFHVASTVMCTSGEGGRGACNGDSGGPLICGYPEDPCLCGATSFGSSMGCEKGYPSAFTKITHYIKWITENWIE